MENSKNKIGHLLVLKTAFSLCIALSIFSCKKDYACACTSTNGVTTISGDTIMHTTKHRAKTACQNGNSSVTNGSVTSVTTCTFF